MSSRVSSRLRALFSIAAAVTLLASLPSSAFAVREKPFRGSEAIKRAKTWTRHRVAYNQRTKYSGYRRDCSGFVSMAWDLPENLVTWRLPLVARRISQKDLRAGDILLDHRSGSKHVVMFERWADKKHTRYVGLESTGQQGVRRAVRRTLPYPYRVNKAYYKPYRYVGMDRYWKAVPRRQRQRVRGYRGPEVTPELVRSRLRAAAERRAELEAERRAAVEAERTRHEVAKATREARKRLSRARAASVARQGENGVGGRLAVEAEDAGKTVGDIVVSLAKEVFGDPEAAAAKEQRERPATAPDGSADVTDAAGE